MASASGSDLAPYLPRLIVDEIGDGGVGTVTFDGTLLVSDLSGFTRLAERLGSEGREAAELLTSIVNDAFATMLGPALERGGDVLSFGGDSATILFRGDGHQRRGVAAAAAMQRSLDARDSIVTGAGRVRLRMSIGVASGTVTVVAAGEAQRALMLLGPTVDEATTLEHRAEATRVLAGASIVAAHPDLPWAERGDDGSAELRWRRFPTEVAVAPQIDARAVGDGLERWIPPALRGHLIGDVDGLGELRRTVVGFVRAAPLSAEPSHEERARAVAAAVEMASRGWGVCWLATDVCPRGLTFVLTAGSPITTEDDVERMHRTMAAVVESAPSGSVRAGIELGLVFAGDLGHPDRRYWTVMGDAVNVAARLAADAAPGEVRCGPTVTAASATASSAVLLGRQPVRGRRSPVAAYRVTPSPPEHHRPGPATPTRFVGREVELGFLVERWHEATAGRGSVVDLVGEPGIGKTRIMHELRSQIDGDADSGSTHVTAIRSDEFHADVAFATAASLLRSVLGIAVDASASDAGQAIAAHIAEFVPHLEPWTPLVADAALAVVASTEAVERLDRLHVAGRRAGVVRELIETVMRGPWLLLVDDLQWIDPSSRELLTGLAESAGGSEWLVVAGRRPTTEPLFDAALSLELEWLGPTQAAELAVAAADPTPLTDEQIQRVVDAASGNPLFLEQLALHATRSDTELPDTIERLIAARIDTLEPETRRLLREVSVVGPVAPLDVVARLLDDDELGGAERWTAMEGLVELVGLVLRFRSGLVRSVAEDGLPYARRRALHRAMAQIIRASAPEDGDDFSTFDDRTLGQFAWHLIEAGDGDAWPACVEAARRARRRAALPEAADLYDHALALPRRSIDVGDDDVARVREEHAQVCLDLGRLDAASASWAAAARAWTRPLDVARTCGERSSVELLRGEYTKALRWGTRGLRLLEDVEGDAAIAVRIRLLLDQSAARLYQGRARQALERAEAAVAEAASGVDRNVEGQVHQHLEMAYSALGDAAALDHGRRAIDCFEATGDLRSLASVLVNTGVTASSRGRWDEAVELYQRAVETIVATGNTTLAAVVTVNRALLLERRGEIDEAEALAIDAERILDASGHEVFVGYALQLRSILALWRRDLDAAAELLGSARDRFASAGAQQMVLDCDVWQVQLLVHAGEPDRAVERAEAVSADIDAAGDTESLPVMIRRLWSLAELRRGNPEIALRLAEQSVERARSHSSSHELALALDALAHAQNGSGQPADPAVLAERDELLAGLGVRRTLLPLAR